MNLIPKELSPITVNHNQLVGCSNSSIVKIVALVSGLLLIGSAVACHIFQVNAIAAYTTGFFGGFVLTIAIASIFQSCRPDSHKETNQSDRETDPINDPFQKPENGVEDWLVSVRMGANGLEKIKVGLDKKAISDLNPLLHEAASLGDAEMVALLLQNGANPKVKNKYGYSAIHLAILCTDNQKGLNVMRLLLENDPKLATLKSTDGATPLHLVASKSSVQNEEVHKQKVDLLIRNGADVNRSDLNPLLHAAASFGDAEMVALLLQKGANPKVKNEHGYSAIHLAIFCTDNQKGLNVMRLLLEKDPKLANLKSTDGATPLHLVASKSSVQNEEMHKQKVDLLISKGADVNAVDSRGYTPLYSSLYSVLREHDPSLIVIEALTTSQTKAKIPKEKNSLTLLQAVQEFHPDWFETHQKELSKLLG